MAITTITKENFNAEVLQSDKPVLIDFWAGWCGPCSMLAPVIDEIASEVQTTKIAKVNIDEEYELATQFGVMSIPTLVVIEGGTVVSQVSGIQPKEKILQMLKQH